MIDTLIQTISNFLVAASTSAMVLIGIQANEPIDSIQHNAVVQEITVTPSPEPSPTQLESQPSVATPASIPVSIPKIDCTGPDGVVFKTTQEECNKFNSAWGNTDSGTTSSDNEAEECKSDEIRQMIDEKNDIYKQIISIKAQMSELQKGIKECTSDGQALRFNQCVEENKRIKNESEQLREKLDKLVSEHKNIGGGNKALYIEAERCGI